MWMPKRYWESIIRKQDDLERRVKRLELMNLKEAESKINSLSNEKISAEDAVLAIEEIIQRPNVVERVTRCF